MWLLILGWLLFLSAHLAPGVFGLRAPIIERLGEKRFLAVYIPLSVTGMSCIIIGKYIAPFVTVWNPPVWGRDAAWLLVMAAFVLLAALLLPTNLKRWTHHPMLWGMACWGIGHLLANGDLASMILFGGFAGYALLSVWSLSRRGISGDTSSYPWWRDCIAVTAGVGGYALVLWLHPYLFGVPVL
jgi:uncharacterized membrane protein